MPTRVSQEYKDKLTAQLAEIEVELCIKVMSITGKRHKHRWWGSEVISDGYVGLRIGLVDRRGVWMVIFDDITLSLESTVNIHSEDIHVNLQDFIHLV